MRHTPQIIFGLLCGSLLLMASAGGGCGFPTQTTFGVGNDGGLRMIVLPEDAEVFVDGASMGPAKQFRGSAFIQLKGGKHVVEIKKPGYADYREEIFVSGNIVTMTVTLKKTE
jgi:hypothetical protein